MKVKTLHLNCLPLIYKMKQASKANENVSKCSNIGLCLTAKVLRVLSLSTQEERYESHLNVTGSNVSGYKFEQKSDTV